MNSQEPTDKSKTPRLRQRPIKNADVPLLEKDWQTANMLGKSQGGSHHTWDKRFALLKQKLIVALKARGKTFEEIAPEIEEKWIGLRRHPSGSCTDAASPKAQAWMQGAPRMEEGWATAAMMAKEHGGDRLTWARQMRILAKDLVRDMAPQVSRSEAMQVLEHNLIGPRQHKTWTTLAASPEAQRLLLEKHTVRTYSREGIRYGKTPPER